MYEDYIYLDLRVVSNFWVYPVLIHSHVANVVEFQALEWAILDSFTGGGCNSVLY